MIRFLYLLGRVGYVWTFRSGTGVGEVEKTEGVDISHDVLLGQIYGSTHWL